MKFHLIFHFCPPPPLYPSMYVWWVSTHNLVGNWFNQWLMINIWENHWRAVKLNRCFWMTLWISTYWCFRSGMGVAGMIIIGYCGSFPHSLLRASKSIDTGCWRWIDMVIWRGDSLFHRWNFQNCSGHDVFSHFLISKMCFTPRPRALFDRWNFQKSSEAVCFDTFDLQMCFALDPCTFWPTLPREGVRARRLSEPIFWPLQTQTTLKNTPFHVIVLSLSFSPARIISLLLIFSLPSSLLSTIDFSLLCSSALLFCYTFPIFP